MEQNLLKIRCVHCGAKLTIRNQANIETLFVECPNCHEKFKVGKGMQNMSVSTSHSASEDTIYHQKGPNSDEDTLITTGYHTLGQLVEITTGRTHSLHPGKNTIGRASSTTSTDVVIEDPSHRMSRQHAFIEVRTMPDGSYRHFLQNWNNKNCTTVGNEQLMQDESIVLQDGQVVTFGSVAIRFVIPDEEGTQLSH